MLLERDIYSETWVHHAARSESVKVWEIAVKALHEEIRPEEVRVFAGQRDRSWSRHKVDV